MRRRQAEGFEFLAARPARQRTRTRSGLRASTGTDDRYFEDYVPGLTAEYGTVKRRERPSASRTSTSRSPA